MPASQCRVLRSDGYLVFTTVSGGRSVCRLNLNTTAGRFSASFRSRRKASRCAHAPDSLSGMLLLMGARYRSKYGPIRRSGHSIARSVVIPRGIAGPYCVGGHEERVRTGCYGRRRQRVNQLVGYAAQAVSAARSDALFEAVSDKNRRCTFPTYMSRGHAFWQLTSQRGPGLY